MRLDKKARIELIITASLIPVLFFILFGSLSGAKAKHPAAAGVPQPPLPDFLISAKQQASEKLDAMSWGRDPFVFGTAKIYSDEDNTLSLNGIAWDEKAPSAIVNNKVVKVGDQIAGNRIADIKKDKVIVTKDGNFYELNLRQKAGQ
jgi:hypothetical protein